MEKLKVVARNSKLSLKQVEEIFYELNEDIEYELIPLLSYGDKHKEISLMENIQQDFFTRELDEAIINGEADIAIHSAKDLPFPLPFGLILAALTKGKDPRDVLVSKNYLTLENLPSGAKVGLSSNLRKQNVLSIRKDIEIVSIRGTIEERLALVDEGIVDAIVVAKCALERLGLSSKIAEILPYETHPLQGKLAVIVKRGRPDLIKLFYNIDERRYYGRVCLVGAGPGNKELITLKAKSCLEYANVVLYDDLVNKDILDFAIRANEKIYVGKRDGRHSISQEEINRLIYKYVLAGKNVVRLKGGEPLVFGRAQEEIDYLKRRFVNVEVINGITSAFAAGASLNISLTNRECGSKIVLESGHLKGKEHNDEICSHIFYMGSSSKKEIFDKMKGFFPLDTPTLLIQNASLPEEVILKIRLDELPKTEVGSPLVIIIGNIGKYYFKELEILYSGINPYETLSKIPGKIIHYPLIKREKILPLPEINFDNFNTIVFTSAFAVDVFTDYYGVKKKKIYAIGERTKERLIERGYNDIIIPDKFDSTSLAGMLIEREKNSKILYPCSNISENKLHKIENLTKIPVYKTTFINQKKLDLLNFDGIYFASGSCVEAFLKIYEKIPSHFIIYVGGETTFEKLKKLGEEKRTIILEKS